MIIEVIEKLEKLSTVEGVLIDEIKIAEQGLNLKFSKEYKDFLENFGAIMADGIEIMGLNVSERINVVDNTLKLREKIENIPKDMYVISKIGMEGIIILQNEKQEIFKCSSNSIVKINDSLVDYIKEI